DRDAREQHDDDTDLGQNARDENADPMNRRQHELVPLTTRRTARGITTALIIVAPASGAQGVQSLLWQLLPGGLRRERRMPAGSAEQPRGKRALVVRASAGAAETPPRRSAEFRR